MSFYVLKFDFLSFKPRTWIENGKLISRTSILGQASRLFAFAKWVIVDRQCETVLVKRRILWFFNVTREIPFDQISKIDYSYSEFADSWSFFWKTDQYEFFTVSLVIGDPIYNKKVKLWTFWGEGSVTRGFSGLLLGDSIFDMSGAQEEQSRDYVTLLQKFTGKPLT